LQALAKARGEAIQKQLAAMGVSGERVRLEKTEVAKADSKASAINTRLTLDVKGVKNTAAANDKTGNTKDIPANEQNVTAKPN
jgi:coenzyme F420-reducing hydrogenase delta subunit